MVVVLNPSDLNLMTHFVFPLKLGPHGAKFGIGAERWLDVLEDIDTNVR